MPLILSMRVLFYVSASRHLTHPTPPHLLYPLSLSFSLLTLHYPLPYALPGIVRSHTECVELVSQKLGGKVLFKRELTVYDQSNTEVRLTLWGDKGNSSSPPFSLPDPYFTIFLSVCTPLEDETYPSLSHTPPLMPHTHTTITP
jgi:hypothetical protein